ncbi:glycerol-3-phosphate dehydrogenase [Agaricicola taiwanensis]|uniref:Glycerol-3-phosphate dehydrogenase n=1 Tax=Agaricicola taiwanensis TaxID=591372 RepID=A0A8J2VIF8_9RHOB|nr:glycerol-3-phosphate dehydrogenase [Agaricicola taiwanensis]GGE30610.1 glycerol-3-phosphate dehydrogenase [Agaricicola taiwanensis]
MTMPPKMDFDLAVIGGGINGCGIARDAAGRGLSVVLMEKGDLAGATSSASTKLIHGGLRYLEHYEFRLVREALAEREVLLKLAPHIIWPLRFVLPHHSGLRPGWMLRLGLFIYDHLGGRSLLPPARTFPLEGDPSGKPLKASYKKASEYSDCWVDDARLVVLNAVDARERGADIRTRTSLISAERVPGGWTLITEHAGRRQIVTARAVVNAAGPWAGDVLQRLGVDSPGHVRLVKGSHIIVDALFSHPHAYIFQNADKRIVFAIPYEHDFTLIGTTDVDFDGDPAEVTIDDDEIDYLLGAVSDYFARPVTRDTLRWSYSGVRPLYDDGTSKAQDATRDYVLELDASTGRAPLLTVFGGKITTYRRLAESVLDKLADHLTVLAPWTHEAALPGGHFPHDNIDALVAALAHKYPFLTDRDVTRMARAYGTDAFTMLGEARNETDMGKAFGAGLTEREVRYLMTREWALTATDVIWRRSKLGLRMSLDDVQALDRWMLGARGGAETAASSPSLADFG